MSANPTTTAPLGSNAHEEASRMALVEGATVINNRGHDVLAAEDAARVSEQELVEHKAANADLLKLHSKTITRYVIYGVGLISVYCLDVLLFGATAEYAATMLTGGNRILVLLAKYGTPLFFLAIEVLCSLKITDAREATREEVPTYGW